MGIDQGKCVSYDSKLNLMGLAHQKHVRKMHDWECPYSYPSHWSVCHLYTTGQKLTMACSTMIGKGVTP